MTPALLFMLAMRLPCWPFEVGGAADVDRAREPAAPPARNRSLPGAPAASKPALGPLAASLPVREDARYDVQYGLLGSVGAVRVSAGALSSGNDGREVVKVHGAGGGSVLGLGALEQQIDTEFDPRALGSTRWTVARSKPGRAAEPDIVDTAARGRDGVLVLERRKIGAPAARQAVAFTVPTSDPLGVLWRLRTAPPALGSVLVIQLLDGLALWRLRVTTAAVGEPPPDSAMPAWRLEGSVEPIFYDGRADPGRPTRRFTLWLSARTGHLPLRLEVPFGLSDVVLSLVEARTVENPSVAPSAATPAPATPIDARPVTDHHAPEPEARGGDQVGAPVPGARSL